MRTLIVAFKLLAVALAMLALAAAPSHATAPGKNGRIAFRRYFDKDHTWGAVFTINAAGTGERQLTHPPKGTVDAPPRWAPDGSLIVFTRTPRRGAAAIYAVRPTGSGLTRLSRACRPGAKCEDSGASFLPNGRHVVFSRFTGNGAGSSIVVTDLHGRNERVVVAGSKHAAYGDPQASPDGKRFVFTRGSEPNETLHSVVVAAASGAGQRQITPTSLDAGDAPDWSPNGRWILFRSHVDDGKQSQIYLVHPDGTGFEQLTHFKHGTIVTSSRFSPDGMSIVFGTTGIGGNADLYVMRADGHGMHPITRTRLWDSAPAWGPT
jgi:TolB protein